MTSTTYALEWRTATAGPTDNRPAWNAFRPDGTYIGEIRAWPPNPGADAGSYTVSVTSPIVTNEYRDARKWAADSLKGAQLLVEEVWMDERHQLEEMNQRSSALHTYATDEPADPMFTVEE